MDDLVRTPCRSGWRGRSDIADVLCLRMEDLREAGTVSLLSDFVGHPCLISDRKSNASDDKRTADIVRLLRGDPARMQQLHDLAVADSSYIKKFYPELAIL